MLAALLYTLAFPHVETAPQECEARNRYLHALHAADQGDLAPLIDTWMQRLAEAL
jgi:hypothetical protein